MRHESYGCCTIDVAVCVASLTQTQNKQKQTSMPRLGFVPTISAFERAKTAHALDRAVTVIGKYCLGGAKLVSETVFSSRFCVVGF
jgi:hypothetical protein